LRNSECVVSFHMENIKGEIHVEVSIILQISFVF
jgi:hypothetical protein